MGCEGQARGWHGRFKRTLSLPERFWSKVDKSGTCWIWIGGRYPDGYGLFHILVSGRWRLIAAHRVAYELAGGTLQGGLTIDHLCRNRLCVRSSHLEQVTRGENTLRGLGPPAKNSRKTHCKRGHALQGENLFIGRNGYRQCATCLRLRSRAGYERRRYRKMCRTDSIDAPSINATIGVPPPQVNTATVIETSLHRAPSLMNSGPPEDPNHPEAEYLTRPEKS